MAECKSYAASIFKLFASNPPRLCLSRTCHCLYETMIYLTHKCQAAAAGDKTLKPFVGDLRLRLSRHRCLYTRQERACDLRQNFAAFFTDQLRLGWVGLLLWILKAGALVPLAPLQSTIDCHWELGDSCFFCSNLVNVAAFARLIVSDRTKRFATLLGALRNDKHAQLIADMFRVLVQSNLSKFCHWDHLAACKWHKTWSALAILPGKGLC